MTRTAASPKRGLLPEGKSIGHLLLEGRAFIALLVIIIIFSSLSPNFFTMDNLVVMTRHVAVNAILAIGMLMVILNAGIDLSVGSTVALSGVVAGYLLQGVNLPFWEAVAYPAVWVVVIISIVIGALVGSVNGILVSKFRVAPFVATLGMMYVVRGIALLITNGLTFPKLGGSETLGNTGFDWVGFNTILFVPVGVIVMILIAGGSSFALNKTPFGRWLYASGGNERAAELSGIPVKRVKISVYVISGAFAAIAGLILTSELTSATPQAGNSYELTAIAAVVIGGASLMGGKGTIRGTLLGAFVIGFLSDGLVIIGVSEYWQMVFKGAVIVLAVMLNAVEYKSRKAKTPIVSPKPASVGAASTPGKD
ncbi:erythritol transport system permease protein [Mycetocola sp. BIGb0189]|uniref:ABC transporter permease n=1 Tax=Mycetocola sp. BIGb0189 TaxID=2940604 RepID=UPI00216776F6|nr:ABC transporter permease [Mycetocola sp. BIGb0189]MCS4276849.1 erythritol transport system permease protein [Mycetocola sp. BIGb0189]